MSRTTKTPLGALLAGTGWLAVAAAIATGTLAPAIFGALLVSCTHAMQRRVAAASLHVEREAPLRAHIGRPFESIVHVRGHGGPVLDVEEDPPPGLLPRAHTLHSGLGHAVARTTFLPRDVGTHTLSAVTVRLGDPWGTHERIARITRHTRVEVAPDPESGMAGRRAGRYAGRSLVAGRVGLETVPEVETARRFVAGDRLRDIDWARTSLLGELYTRQRERVVPRPVTVVVDASESMLWHRRHAKLTSASRVALGIVEAARVATLPAQLVVASPRHAVHAGTATRGSAPATLAALPSTVAVEALPDLAQGRALKSSERRALRTMRSLQGGTALDPWQAAIGAVHRLPESFAVVIMDAELDPASCIRRMAAIARTRRAVLVVPATGSHHYVRSEAKGRELERLRTWRRNRLEVARAMDSRGIPTVVLHPDNVASVVEEVVRWTR